MSSSGFWYVGFIIVASAAALRTISKWTMRRNRKRICQMLVVFLAVSSCYVTVYAQASMPERDQLPLGHEQVHAADEVVLEVTAPVAGTGGDTSKGSASNVSADGLPILLPQQFTPLPMGSIQPLGWLKRELEHSANALHGHLYDFYNFVKYSPWLGDTSGRGEYSNLNEALPYWVNGMVPLAYALDDKRLQADVHKVVDYVLTQQDNSTDGWLGPEQVNKRLLWGRFPFALGLMNLAEADSRWTERAVDSLHKFVSIMHEMLKDNFRGYKRHRSDELGKDDYHWGRTRYGDMIVVLQWMYEKHPRARFEVLLECMKLLHEGALQWGEWYHMGRYPFDDLYDLPERKMHRLYHFQHGVNVGQGLKASAVVWRFTHNETLLADARNAVHWSFTYHGQSSGTIIADERLDGLSPYSGSELCTAVETMYSLSYMYQVMGDNDFADYCELGAFNAFPVMMTSDHWAHQYMAEANQPFSRKLKTSPFYNANEYSQTYGLEPNYPCCTVNHGQGMPKFLAATFVHVGENGLAHALLSPAKVKTTLESGEVEVTCTTNYPFGNALTYEVKSEGAFDFYVRVPGWAHTGSWYTAVNGVGQLLNESHTTGMKKLQLGAGATTVELVFAPEIRTVHSRDDDMVAVYRGALLYALEVGSEETYGPPKHYQTHKEYPADYAPQHVRDWTFTNTTSWNIAINPFTLKYHGSEDDNNSELKDPIFAPKAPPGYMTAQGCEIEWPMYKKSVPGLPVAYADRKCLGPQREVTLRPYGSTKLHIADIPVILLDHADSASGG